MDWKPISTAPYSGDLELAVIDKDGPHTVAFACRRVVGGWIAAETNKHLAVPEMVSFSNSNDGSGSLLASLPLMLMPCRYLTG